MNAPELSAPNDPQGCEEAIRAASPRGVMLLGTSPLVVGVGVTLLAITHASAAGFLVVHLGVLTTARDYGVVVIVLAAIALVDVARPRRRERTPAAG